MLNFKKFKEDHNECSTLENDLTLDSDKFLAEIRKMETNFNHKDSQQILSEEGDSFQC